MKCAYHTIGVIHDTVKVVAIYSHTKLGVVYTSQCHILHYIFYSERKLNYVTTLHYTLHTHMHARTCMHTHARTHAHTHKHIIIRNNK